MSPFTACLVYTVHFSVIPSQMKHLFHAVISICDQKPPGPLGMLMAARGQGSGSHAGAMTGSA